MAIKPSEKPVMVRVIEKARKNGWDMYGWKNYMWSEAYGIPIGLYNPDDDTAVGLGIHDIIFNHDFAKALWSEEINDEEYRYTSYEIPMWQYHLQQMVLAEDPIKYLEENI